MKVLFLILCLVTSFPAQTFPIENGWKGIKVLKTSRVEVEKLFGKPVEKRVYERYETEDAFIDVDYSFSPCSDNNRGEFNLPQDTVLDYSVVIKKEIKLSDFKWKKDL